MPEKLIRGVYAAVSTPRHQDGRLNEEALVHTLEYLMGRGVRGFALNGATGEYCLTSYGDLRAILAVSRGVMAGEAEFVCGIGSAGLAGCGAKGELALEAGARAVLLPMPHFFPYEQDDLEAFCGAVAERLKGSILLYNLPQFTSGLEGRTVRRLIEAYPNIIGIKDSSGSLDILRALTAHLPRACRLVGNDAALPQALREDVCDGVISGVAGVLPELILDLFGQRGEPSGPQFGQVTALLDELLAPLGHFPTPWGLKWIGESRGIAPAIFGQPLSPRRSAEGREFQRWFREWSGKAVPAG